MVSSYAIIIDNKVVNRIVADPVFIVDYCNEIGASFSTYPGAQVGAERIGDEWVVPQPVPEEVTRFQARTALLEAGLLDQVQVVMDDPETDPAVVIAWQDKQVFRRTSPTIAAIAQQLELTEEEVDDLFRLAATIEA